MIDGKMKEKKRKERNCRVFNNISTNSALNDKGINKIFKQFNFSGFIPRVCFTIFTKIIFSIYKEENCIAKSKRLSDKMCFEQDVLSTLAATNDMM